MSSRMKRRLRNRFIARVLNGKVTADEARRALADAGFPVKGPKPAATAAKSAAPAPRPAPPAGPAYKSFGSGRAPEQSPSAAQIYSQFSSPAIREGAFQAAHAVRRA